MMRLPKVASANRCFSTQHTQKSFSTMAGFIARFGCGLAKDIAPLSVHGLMPKRRSRTRKGNNLRGQTPKSCRLAGDRGRVTVSADIHVHVVLLTVVEKWDGSIGALHAIEDNPRHGITPVVADADVVERLAVAVVDLE